MRSEHVIADGGVKMTVDFDAPKKAKHVYSLQDVEEQIEWHKDRLWVLEQRIANGECG